MIINSAAELDNISNPAPDGINEDQNLGQAQSEMTLLADWWLDKKWCGVWVVGGGGWKCRLFIHFQSDNRA